jgi:hypothetical protein
MSDIGPEATLLGYSAFVLGMALPAPKPTPTLTPAVGQVGWKADRGLQQVAYNAERETTTRDGA